MLRLAKVVGLIRNDWWQWWQREPSCTNGTNLDSNYVLTQWLAEYPAVLHLQSKYRSSFWVCFLWTTAGIQMEPRDFPPVFKFIHPCAFFISVGNRVCVSLESKKEEKNYNSQHQIFDSIHFLLSVLPSRIWDSRWEEKLWPPPKKYKPWRLQEREGLFQSKLVRGSGKSICSWKLGQNTRNGNIAARGKRWIRSQSLSSLFFLALIFLQISASLKHYLPWYWNSYSIPKSPDDLFFSPCPQSSVNTILMLIFATLTKFMHYPLSVY